VTALMYQIVNFAPPAPSSVNSAVPEMLDFIVAKMLAKPLEERYQDAKDLARDLRECERSLAAPPSAPPARPGGAGIARGAQPEFVDSSAKTIVLAQTVNRTRVQDQAVQEPSPPAAQGVSPSFDSAEATQRLAAMTGAVTLPLTNTQVVGAMPRGPRAGWRRRDWLLVGGAALAGLLVAGTLVRRR
jgi:serine/threonine-protein kinase